MTTAPTSSGAVLSVSDLSFSYDALNLAGVKDLNLTVNHGEIICILGASGCGKSTLLNLIAGLILPDKGSIVIASEGQTKRRIGYIFQDDALLPWRTVEANLLLVADIDRTVTKAAAMQQAMSYLNTFGLDGAVLKKYPSELSGGMRQRVSIIQSLMFNPQLLLLDEPFSALDFFTKLKLESEFVDLVKKQNRAAVIVTHDIEEAIAMADRVILMGDGGRITNQFLIDFEDSRPAPQAARGTAKFAALYQAIWAELKTVIEQ